MTDLKRAADELAAECIASLKSDIAFLRQDHAPSIQRDQAAARADNALAALSGLPRSDATFAEWLATEMPAGTIISDPAWWADRIARQYAMRSTQPATAPVGVDAGRIADDIMFGWRLAQSRVYEQDVCRLASNLQRAALAQQPAAVDDPDKRLLNAVADRYWGLVPFNMPTPAGDDADVGWRVIEYHRAEPQERVVVEHFHDDPRAALTAALTGPQQEGQP